MKQCSFCKIWTHVKESGLCDRCESDPRKIYVLIQQGIKGKELLQKIVKYIDTKNLSNEYFLFDKNLYSDILHFLKIYNI